jgi:hypothetical protein
VQVSESTREKCKILWCKNWCEFWCKIYGVLVELGNVILLWKGRRECWWIGTVSGKCQGYIYKGFNIDYIPPLVRR